MDPRTLVGKSYTFEDGNRIDVFQVKNRDDNIPYVTYHISTGPGIPRKLVLPIHEFIEHYGHLFGLISDDNIPE